MKPLELETLRHMKHFGPIRLSGCGEPMRQCLISLGMHEPPMVDVDGNWVYLTEPGRAEVAKFSAAGAVSPADVGKLPTREEK